jgi:hypothetical protein
MTAKKKDLSREDRFEIATKKGRRARVPMHAQMKLGFPTSVERKGDMHYCWAMDDGKGNLEKYEAAYYEFALNSAGGRESRQSGNGQLLYLMQIEEEYYQEDYAKEQEACIDTLSNKAALGANEYVPQGHSAVLSKNMRS